MKKLQSIISEYSGRISPLRTLGAILICIGLLSPAAKAQTTFKPFQIRAEWPAGVAGTLILSNNNLRVPTNGAPLLNDGTGTNWDISAITISISGVPSGVTATLTDSNLNSVTTIPVTLNTSNAALNTNLFIKLDFSGTQTSGNAMIGFTFSGGVTNDYFAFPLDIGKIWNGAANAAVNGAGNWSDGAQWLGGAPATGDSVVFTDVGTQTNSLNNGTAYLTNSIVDSTLVLSSLRFAQTNSGTNFQNLYVSPGVTLALNGSGGFSMLKDVTYVASKMNVYMYGTNGAFVQTNENSNFSMLSDGQQASVLDMSGLGNVYLDVNRVAIGDIEAYPNYHMLQTNAYNQNSTAIGAALPMRALPTWKMGKTNYVRAVYADPNNYTSGFNRNYSIEIGRNNYGGGSSGTDHVISMGVSNAFYADSICVAGYASLGGVLQFLNTGSYALFRGTNGGRMSVFATADAAHTPFGSTSGDNTKCASPGVDFTKGTVDMLVDRLYLSLDGGNVTASGKGTSQTAFMFSSGTIDANNAILAYQSQGDQTNASACNATLTVSNTAIFKVNDTLTLGYTTATTGGAPQNAAATSGKINIGPGGTVMANTISVGGVTKVSTANNISLIGSASLIVSNRLGDSTAGGALGTLTMSGGNDSVTLFVNGNNASSAIAYVSNLVASGTGNKMIIGGITNLTYPAYVPLIAGAGASAISASAFDAGVIMPAGSGLFGTLVTSSSNTIDLQIIARTPNHLLWRGAADGSGTANWDYVTKNWLDQTTGLMTNYDNPDIVAFDDAPGYATNINMVAGTAFTPGSITITNNNLLYTMTGANQVLGGPALNKYGFGVVDIEGTTTISAQLNQGVLIGGGSIGNASVASGAILYFNGTLGGSLTCAGTATAAGPISGTVTVLSGGAVTNSSYVTNSISVQSGGLFYNGGTLINIGTGTAGSPNVATNGLLINSGTINGDILYIAGTFKDMGGSASSTLTSVTFGPNATFIPGGDGTDTTTVNSDGVGSFPGAVLLSQGSQAIIKIDPAAPANAVVKAAHLSFGASGSAQTVNGCTLVISNTTATAFTAGQSFHVFQSIYNGYNAPFDTGSSTNTYPVVIPGQPGAGLSWDLSQLWSGGSIGVITTPVVTMTNSFSVSSSNIVSTFSWPSDLQWVLESQQSTLDVGLTTNWTRVGGSWTNTDADTAAGYRTRSITNSISTNSATFYRLVFP